MQSWRRNQKEEEVCDWGGWGGGGGGGIGGLGGGRHYRSASSQQSLRAILTSVDQVSVDKQAYGKEGYVR